jgi:Holliday junction DNA helicase RuvA
MSCLTSLSGVGKKTAQRLCMELADKVSGLALEQTGSTASQSGSTPPQSEGFAMQDAASALINLGYPPETAWQALRSVQQADPEGAAKMQVDELIRNVLRTLA